MSAPALRVVEIPSSAGLDTPAPATAPNVLAGWEGAQYGLNHGVYDYIDPPDVPLAVGPGHVFELVNGLGIIWTKSGTFVQLVNPETLFQVAPTDGIGDARVLYDALSGRWFASAGDFTTGNVVLAVSGTGDPSGGWTGYTFSTNSGCPDQPYLGLSSDKVVLSLNTFTSCDGTFLGGMFWAINKSDLVSGATPRYTVWGPSLSYLNMVAIQGMSAATPAYIVRPIQPNYVRVYTLSGVPPGTVGLSYHDYGTSTFITSPNAVQPGTNYTLRTGDNRARDGFWSSGRLWLAFNDGCTPSGDTTTRACFRLDQFDTTNHTVLQDFDVGEKGTDSIYPALRTDGNGNLAVLFGLSSSTVYPSIAVAVQSPSDPLNALGPWAVVRPGTGSRLPGSGSCTSYVCRYGDYFGVAIDPSNTSRVYTAGEYGNTTGWGTYVSLLGTSGGAPPTPPPATVTLTISYSAPGGGSGYEAPTLAYVLNGTPIAVTLSTTATAYTVDADSAWSVTNPLVGSTSSERWSTSQATAGTATGSTTIAFSYYHQYLVTFLVQVVNGNFPPTTPMLTATVYGSPTNAPMGGSTWVDANGSYAYPGTVSGASGERWQTSSPPSGTVTLPATITASYYHEYNVGFAYQVSGGGSGYGTPAVSYVSLGSGSSTAAGTAVWADAGSTFAFAATLSGSSSSERWQSAAPGGTVTVSGTVTVTYLHQYWVGFAFTVTGGGSGYSAPNVTYSNLTITSSTPATSLGGWADAGSGYVYENPLPGSTSTNGWRTNNGRGTVRSSATYSATYKHQYKVRFKATTASGAPTPEAPMINCTVFGTTVSVASDNETWVDADGAYSFPGVFYGPLPGERWITNVPPSGLVLAPMNVTAVYAHQYYLAIQVNAAAGGSVTGTAGWYNETNSLTLVAGAGVGWRFEGWIGSGEGSYSGTSPNAEVTLYAPVTETAVFYAGLNLGAGNGGSLAYSYGGTSGWVPAGASETIYVAPGTNVTVAASPSWFFEFNGWDGESVSSSTIRVLVEMPQSVHASFGVSLYSKLDSVLGVIVVVTVFLAVLLETRHRKRKRKLAAQRAVVARARRQTQGLR